MSSTDTLGPSCLEAPSRSRTVDVAVLMPQTSGRTTSAKNCMTGAARRANDSARRSASRFGTSSPSRSVTNDRSITNTVSAMGFEAAASGAGAWVAIRSAKSLTSRSPP